MEVNILSKDRQFVTDADGNRIGEIVPYEEGLYSLEEADKENDVISHEPIEISREELTFVLQRALAASLELPGDPRTTLTPEQTKP